MHPRESTSKLTAALALCGIVLFLTACETEKPAAAPVTQTWSAGE